MQDGFNVVADRYIRNQYVVDRHFHGNKKSKAIWRVQMKQSQLVEPVLMLK